MSKLAALSSFCAAVCGLIILPASVGGAFAADKPSCNLVQVTSLEMLTEPSGAVTVPATIDGVQGQVLIDTGGINSLIGQSIANKLGLTAARSGPHDSLLGGVPINQFVRPQYFQLGLISSRDMPMMIAPTSLMSTNTIAMLAPNYLSHFDVEFDFAAGRFYLFSQEHCPGSVVHWTQASYASLPIELDTSSHIFVSAMLDGKEVRAALDTGSAHSTMTMDQAHALFGLKLGDPLLKYVGPISVNGTAASAVYHYPFATLTFNGMQVQSPDIQILAGQQFGPGVPQLIVGMETLRQLHLYIAYGEKMIYLTPAETR